MSQHKTPVADIDAIEAQIAATRARIAELENAIHRAMAAATRGRRDRHLVALGRIAARKPAESARTRRGAGARGAGV